MQKREKLKDVTILYKYNKNHLILKKECYHNRSAYKYHNPYGDPAYEEYYDLSNKTLPKKFEYYINGRLHREDGPAIIEWNQNGNIINQKYFLNGKEVDELVILVRSQNNKIK